MDEARASLREDVSLIKEFDSEPRPQGTHTHTLTEIYASGGDRARWF